MPGFWEVPGEGPAARKLRYDKIDIEDCRRNDRVHEMAGFLSYQEPNVLFRGHAPRRDDDEVLRVSKAQRVPPVPLAHPRVEDRGVRVAPPGPREPGGACTRGAVDTELQRDCEPRGHKLHCAVL